MQQLLCRDLACLVFVRREGTAWARSNLAMSHQFHFAALVSQQLARLQLPTQQIYHDVSWGPGPVGVAGQSGFLRLDSPLTRPQ